MFGVESEQEVNFCCFKLPRFWSYYEGIILTCTREPVEIAEICFPTSKSFFFAEGSDPAQDLFNSLHFTACL